MTQSVGKLSYRTPGHPGAPHWVPKELAAAIASYDVSASQGALYGSERTLSQLIGRPTTTLATSVERALKSL